jgi:hypothetical protein
MCKSHEGSVFPMNNIRLHFAVPLPSTLENPNAGSPNLQSFPVNSFAWMI